MLYPPELRARRGFEGLRRPAVSETVPAIVSVVVLAAYPTLPQAHLANPGAVSTAAPQASSVRFASCPTSYLVVMSG